MTFKFEKNTRSEHKLKTNNQYKYVKRTKVSQTQRENLESGVHNLSPNKY
jgi:hypothetical protein